MKLAIVVALGIGALAFTAPTAAAEDCQLVEETRWVGGEAVVTMVLVCDEREDEASAVSTEPRDSNVDTVCVREALEQGLDPIAFCDVPAEEAASIALTPDMVAAAFSRIPLPPSKLSVQPPNGRTLVNFETNFFTESEPFTRSVTLLGQRVQLEITPATFGWRFGDGETMSTSSPGSAFPDLEITHTYLRKGRVTPSVDTTYTATYSVNGGPTQPVPGSVTIPGAPVSLRVVTASPQLVG